MKLIEYPDREMMMIDLANQLAGDLKANVKVHGEGSFAVPGGTTPGPIFDVLCAADLDWSQITIMLTDERWVPETSERSNSRLIRERLLTNRASAARFLTFYDGSDNPEAAATAVSQRVAAHLPLSVVLLGMGADMHTASLFPWEDDLATALEPDAPPVMAMRAPEANEQRITLTAPVLSNAAAKHIVITGSAKREALDRAAHLNSLEAPVNAVWDGAKVHWAE